jgi:peptidoglycan biosynthesis protein MviN/MurJ (putative lipid II flippase)
VLSLVLMQTPLNYGGLALANSIAALAEAAILIRLVSLRLKEVRVESLITSSVRILAASLVMGLPVAWLAAIVDPLVRSYGTLGQAALLAVCVPFGAALYALISLLFRSDELQALWRLLRR